MVTVNTLLLIFRLLPSVIVINPPSWKKSYAEPDSIEFEEYLDITTAAGKRVTSSTNQAPNKKRAMPPTATSSIARQFDLQAPEQQRSRFYLCSITRENVDDSFHCCRGCNHRCAGNPRHIHGGNRCDKLAGSHTHCHSIRRCPHVHSGKSAISADRSSVLVAHRLSRCTFHPGSPGS